MAVSGKCGVLFLVFLLAAVPATSASRAGGEISECRNLYRVSASPRSARPRDLELRVSYSLQTSATGPQVQWTLSLRNRISRALRLSFPTSQYANVVLRRSGKIMYSWGSHRAFLQVVTARRLPARTTYVCSLGPPDPLDLEPGRYELIAYLASTVSVRTRRSLVVPGRLRPAPPAAPGSHGSGHG
jgi:hypothetical protein